MNEKTPRRDPYRLIGEIFNERYSIDEFVVLGSFGAVYRATDRKLGRIVAVKILKPDLKEDVAEQARELFQREAQAAGALNHPHIVAVTDVGEDFGIAYLVMEWLDGRTLEQELRQNKRISIADAKVILEQITGALTLAHEQNIVHRDIKPSNIHLGKFDEIFVKVLDFGIAKVTTSAANAVASRIAGTFAYMPPEQIEGKIIDARTDIYALGIVFFQMLAGRLPFEKKSEEYLMQQQITAKPPRLTDFSSDINPAIADVIEQSMAKNPDNRQQSVAEFYEAFVRASENGGSTGTGDQELAAINDNESASQTTAPKKVSIPENALEPQQQTVSPFETNIARSPAVGENRNAESIAPIAPAAAPKIEVADFGRSNFQSAGIWTLVYKYQIQIIGALLILAVLVGWFAISSYRNYRSAKLVGYLQNGTKLLDAKQYAEALSEFDQAVRTDSDSAEAFKGRGDAYHFTGDSEKAIGDYSRAIELGLTGAEIYRRRGFDQKAVLNFDKAITDYTEAIKIAPNDSLSYSGRCQTYIENRQFDLALTDCNRAIELDPESVDAYVSRGYAFLSGNDNDAALADFDKAIKLQSGNVSAYLGRGNAYYNAGNFSKALDDFSEAIKLDPQNQAAYGLRGLIYQKQQNFDKAIASYDEAIRLNPRFSLLYAGRGKSYLMEKKFDEAIGDYTRAIEFNNGGKAADFYFERGIAYFEKKEYDKAISDWTEVINLDPKSYGAYQNRSAAYARQGKKDLAAADARQERLLRREK